MNYVLLQFNFNNFKSFKDEATLDLSAIKLDELCNHVISMGKERILPIAAIFGANASGKTNIHEAFRYMTTYVVNSFTYGDSVVSSSRTSPNFLEPTPFLFDNNHETSFEVYFIDSEENTAISYNYGFTVDKNGIIEEWLNYKPTLIQGDYTRVFYRNNEIISEVN